MKLNRNDLNYLEILSMDQISNMVGMKSADLTHKLLQYPYFQNVLNDKIMSKLKLDERDTQKLGYIAASFVSLDNNERERLLNCVAVMQCQKSILTSTSPEFLKSLSRLTGNNTTIELLRDVQFVPLKMIEIPPQVTIDAIQAVSNLIGRLALGQLPPSYLTRYRVLDNRIQDGPVALQAGDRNLDCLDALFRHAMQFCQFAAPDITTPSMITPIGKIGDKTSDMATAF